MQQGQSLRRPCYLRLLGYGANLNAMEPSHPVNVWPRPRVALLYAVRAQQPRLYRPPAWLGLLQCTAGRPSCTVVRSFVPMPMPVRATDVCMRHWRTQCSAGRAALTCAAAVWCAGVPTLRIRFAVTQLLKVFHCANPEAENKQKRATSGNSFIEIACSIPAPPLYRVLSLPSSLLSALADSVLPHTRPQTHPL